MSKPWTVIKIERERRDLQRILKRFKEVMARARKAEREADRFLAQAEKELWRRRRRAQ